ncbi:MAG: hypothetical protein IKE53_03885 [Clostridiales bacterium]|nr:hypothetical protein [Clostridiales bacterium]
MKAFGKKKRRQWITVWLVVVSIILGIMAAFAIYTEVSSIKRVVTTKSAPKELFSSNCMYAELYDRRMPAREFNVNVNNFDVSDPNTPNPTEIQYTLSAQLQVKYNGTIMTFEELHTFLADDTATYNKIVERAKEGYYIGKSQDNNSSGIIANPVMTEFLPENSFRVTFSSETLPGSVTSTDRFKVVIPQDAFNTTDPEFYVYVKADPVDAGLTDIQTRLYGSKNVIVTASWSGTLVEQNTATRDYDFYNYVISGSGSATLDIMWDPKWFEIDDFFFNSSLSGVTFSGGDTPTRISGGDYDGWYKISIVVDSVNDKSRYELQLYKVKENIPYTGDDNAANHIACVMQ